MRRRAVRAGACLLSALAVGAGATAASAATYTATQVIPVPAASTYQGSGGGDGWAVALSSQYVFNVFHHNSILQVACHKQSNSSSCGGPETVTDATGTNFATSGQPGLYLDQNLGRLYVYATRESDDTGGVVCVDTAQVVAQNDPFCGFTPLTASGQAPLQDGISAISNPVVVGSRWFAFNYVNAAGPGNTANQLLCFDLTSFSPCAGQPFTLSLGPGTMSSYDFPPPAVAAIGTDVIVPANLGSSDELACFNGATLHACAGSWPVSLGTSYDSSYGAPYPLMDGQGGITGLCLPTGGDQCYSLDGSSAPTPGGMPAAIPSTSGWNGPAFVLGPRVYVPNGNTDSVDCYDYSAGAGCANFPVSLPNLGLLYTVNGDPQRPSCIWVNSDDGGGQIQNFDAYTAGACAGGPIRVLASSLVGSSRACAPGNYTALQVVSPGRLAYSDGTVSFEDGDGNSIPGAGEIALDGTGTAGLSGLRLSTQTGLPQFLITLNGASDSPKAVTVKLTWSAGGNYDPACVNGGGAYIALGDSYSAGEGNFPFLNGTDTGKGQPNNKCHRSTFSYPFHVNLDLGYFAPRFSFHACSGAVIPDMYHPNGASPRNIDLLTGRAEPAQLSWLSGDVGENASLVTLTIGGNDARFADVMTTCVENAFGITGIDNAVGMSVSNDCEAVWTSRVNSAVRAMGQRSGPESLSALYAHVAGAAPHARIVVLGYPRFFPTKPPNSCPTGALDTTFPYEHMRWIDSEIQSMDNTISGAVASLHNPRVLYVDAYDAFHGHERCTSNPWLYGVKSLIHSNIQSGSFHPTMDGQRALTVLVERALHVH